ncbi:MAG: ribonuclease HII [Spirochaetes bacterium]|nr:ribonuclease HII [Spirochaetota bacterium]
MPDNISFDIEKELLAQNYNFIAGIDEAGRGALAGPLVVGLAIYSKSHIQNPPEKLTAHVKDSKQLTQKKRIEALHLINKTAVYCGFAVIPHETVDRMNVNAATEYAVKQLLQKATPVPDVVIIDGNFRFSLDIPYHSIIKGDQKSFSIASGSILAKVNRDWLMAEFDKEYPGYSFSKNMGYGTKEHINAIYSIGPSAIHRKTYKPVSQIYNSVTIL